MSWNAPSRRRRPRARILLGGLNAAAVAVALLVAPGFAAVAAPALGAISAVDVASQSAPTTSVTQRELLPSDDLFVASGAAEVSAVLDGSGNGTHGTDDETLTGEFASGASASSFPVLEYGSRSVAARPLDPYTDRVAELGYVDGTTTLQLRLDGTAANLREDGGWASTEAITGAPVVGQTVVFHAAADSETLRLQQSADGSVLTPAATGVEHSPQRQWSVIAGPTLPDWGATVRFVNRASGLCLADGGSLQTASATPCQEGAGDSTQLWAFSYEAELGGVVVESAGDGGILHIDAAGAVAKVDYVGPITYWSFDEVVEPGGVAPTWSIANDSPGRTVNGYDLAIGDLDGAVRYVGDDGSFVYGDEAVVAYTDAQGKLQVEVIDYNANESRLLSTALELPETPDAAVTADIGDFDGDGRNDIAVTSSRAGAGSRWIYILHYEAGSGDAAGTRTLTTTAMNTYWYPGVYETGVIVDQRNHAVVDGVADDFDGDGRDELALSFVDTWRFTWGTQCSSAAAQRDGWCTDAGTAVPAVAVITPDLTVYDGEVASSISRQLWDQPCGSSGCTYDIGDEIGQGTLVWQPLDGIASGSTADGGSYTRLELGSGVFRDSDATIAAVPRQLVATVAYPLVHNLRWLSYSDGSEYLKWDRVLAHEAYTYGIGKDAEGKLIWTSGDLQWREADGQAGGDTDFDQGDDVWSAYESRYSLAVGTFTGGTVDLAAESWPLSSIAVATQVRTAKWYSEPRINVIRADKTLAWSDRFIHGDADHGHYEPGVRYTLTAFDRTGASLILGPPITFDVQNFVRPLQVASAPPSHADWLTNDSGTAGFTNVSRSDGYYTSYGTSDSTAFQSSSVNEVSGSVTVSESSEFSAGATFGIPSVAEGSSSVTFKQNLELKTGFTFSDTNTDSTTVTTKVSGKTNTDDWLGAVVQNVRIYRYPVYGSNASLSGSCGTATSGCVAYYERVLPWGTTEKHGAGATFEQYAPQWQVGNALSYPTSVSWGVSATDTPNVPPGVDDLGSYTIGEGAAAQTIEGTLVDTTFGVGGAATTQTLEVKSSDGSSTSEKATAGLSSGSELSGSTSLKTSPFGPTASEKVSVGVKTDFNGSTATTASTTTSHEQSFTTQISGGVAAAQGYDIRALYYYTQAGYPKISYAVQLDQNWWAQNYGGADAALNLYESTVIRTSTVNGVTSTLPYWSSDVSRQKIRGFTARVPDDASTDPAVAGAEYASNPQVGDPVTFDVEVANYSVATPLDPSLTVDFYAVQVDSLSGKVIGEETYIGRSTVAESSPSGIAPQEAVTVSSPTWIAPAVTSTVPDSGGQQKYRIFVVLDQDDAVSETHEWAGEADGSDWCPASSISGDTKLYDPRYRYATAYKPEGPQQETLTCGQNNQGWGEIAVSPASSAAGSDATASAGAAVTATEVAAITASTAAVPLEIASEPTELRFDGASISVDGGEFQRLDESSAIPAITQGQQVTIAFHVESDEDLLHHQIVYLHDGDLDTGELVDSEVLRGVSVQDGGVVTFTLDTSELEVGSHELHHEAIGTATATGDAQLLRINVKPAPVEPTATPTAQPTSPGVVDPDDGAEVVQSSGPTIVRFAERDRVGTAIEAAQLTEGTWWQNSSLYGGDDGIGRTVILASAEQYPDALAAASLADAIDAPVLLNPDGDTLDERVAQYLDEQDIENVVLASGTGVLSPALQQRLVDEGYSTSRIAGANRYETATLLAAAAIATGEYPVSGTANVFLADGTNFPDALAAGAAAAQHSGVVLLTDGDRGLSAATLAFLEGQVTQIDAPWFQGDTELESLQEVYAVGGNAARAAAKGHDGVIPDASYLTGSIVGEDRYQTATLLAEQFFGATASGVLRDEGAADADVFTIASGEKFADAIVAGAWAANADGPLLLTQQGELNASTAEYLLEHVEKEDAITVFGGTASVSTSVTDELRRLFEF